MAKGKRSVALFEVIQSSKSSRGGLSLRTPKWWFKHRTASGEPVGPGAPVEAPPEPARVTVAPAECTAPAPRVPGVDLKMDPEYQRIKFNLSYTSAGIAAFTVIVAVGLAYLIGQRMQHGPAPALAQDATDIIRQGPIRKGVLEMLTLPPTAGSNAKRSTPPPEKSQAAQATPGAPTPAASTPAAPSEALNTAKRVSGYQYLLIQSYPDEKRASDAKDLLTKNGVTCTIEQNIPGWNNLFCVIGSTGFPKASGAEYDKYKNSITQLNQSFKKDQKFMSFDPTPIRWKG